LIRFQSASRDARCCPRRSAITPFRCIDDFDAIAVTLADASDSFHCMTPATTPLAAFITPLMPPFFRFSIVSLLPPMPAIAAIYCH
jgi:hypothetical protein